ncbi:MAG: hypothetical protein ACD_3C00051G0016 [uncultured bacterium (gcode 4)]|uniref:Uncharacterized protein n=1 Tax=uncultured bacterium (gcode 4) TaxID=1234023 RepID=K2FZY5_9BACT|nr:MAG: hypothetical protein ACD_3C00051G0016 [uncultured bacterium (gcode 4)]
MHKKVKYSLFITIALLLTASSFLIYDNWLISKEINDFKSMSIDNPDTKICDNLTDASMKNKCYDNYHSIIAFKKLDYKLCNGILDKDLTYSCIRSILFFKAKSDRSEVPCEVVLLDKDDRVTCKDYVKLENMMSWWTVLPDCSQIGTTEVALACQETKNILRND